MTYFQDVYDRALHAHQLEAAKEAVKKAHAKYVARMGETPDFLYLSSDAYRFVTEAFAKEAMVDFDVEGKDPVMIMGMEVLLVHSKNHFNMG